MNFRLFSYSILLVVTLLIAGCSQEKQVHSEMNHAGMDHSEMNHSEMEHTEEKPIPKTLHMAEVTQQDLSGTVNAWHKGETKGNQVKVAVLDTGIDQKNNDLQYTNGINLTGADEKGFNDDNGHGTKIAGIICARENEFNLLGIAPECELTIAKVADSNGNVQVENLIQGIEWAVNEKVDVINISLELPKGTKKLHDSIKKATAENIIIVASSGNIKQPGDASLSYPGAYQEVINVGMLDTEGEMYSAEFKKKKVDVYAPGEDIYSSYFNDKMTLDTGVSFATAYASGYATLLIQYFKENNIPYDQEKIIEELSGDLETHM